MSMRIAFFGGSFDPPHLGHKALVDSALAQLNLDKIWVIPVGLPVHRQLSGKASPKQRLSWLSTIFADEPRVRIVDWEVNHTKPSPAIATLRRFQAENPNIIPIWLMGLDSFLDMPNWVEYPEHQKLCNLAVFQRENIKKTVETMGWKGTSTLNHRLDAGHVIFINQTLPDISATQIRNNPKLQQKYLHQDTCNAILACYASGEFNKERTT
ncbi:nicotinate (nicotinamide) nucleotide adenylyltransferase [Ghiorsea bivora]|uniref:nicotinate (nicotinamide) nucleotide adenylyltransferase n=1 Tax=Ghiorsea bivora TaxID=1485545 RepID=UPI00068B6F0C|nr:nicotinate (nicotinamide) nucleotide adenylyltransferase [Ghiorsea bivora]